MRKWLAKFLLGNLKEYKNELRGELRSDIRDWLSETVTNTLQILLDEKTLKAQYLSNWDTTRVRNGLHSAVMQHVDDIIMKKIEQRINERLDFINQEKIIDEIVDRINKKQIR